jgi:hypothetical protein
MRKTSEFDHYDGCRRKDPANCSACALTDTRQETPNYSAWPLAYMENERGIPAKWKAAFLAELQSSNTLYAANLRKHIREHGARFSDGTSARFVDSNGTVEIR